MLPLNNFGGPTAGRARSISADGTVVVGDQRSGSMDLPYRWTLAGGTTPLSLPIGSTSGSAYGLSGDGQISVGATSQGTISRVTKWTSSGASVPLGSLSGSTSGIAHDASHAGNVIVGAVADQAVRWTSDNAAHGLGFFPGGTRVSLAEAVSSDGQVVVGYSDSVMGFQAFVWHPSTGMHNLRSILTDAGLNLTGWTLRSATDISADGTTIVGYADNPSGKQEACIATIPAIPEPVALFPAIGTLFLLVHRRVNVSKSRVASARTRGAVGGRRNVTQSSGRFTPVF
jgi:probable HAF family extracellular repeat protein